MMRFVVLCTCTIYKSTPCTSEVQVRDNGEPGSSDTFTITGVDLTTASGTLQGGNIQIHSIEDERGQSEEVHASSLGPFHWEYSQVNVWLSEKIISLGHDGVFLAAGPTRTFSFPARGEPP
jgi:hypothetical protein